MRAATIGVAAVVLALWGSAAGSAHAATAVSGDRDSGSPLVVDPSGDAFSFERPFSGSYDNTVARIAKMPVTKTVNRITIGDLGLADRCTTPANVNLVVHESKAGDFGPRRQLTNSLRTEVLPATPGKVSWEIPPTTLEAGADYRFSVYHYTGCDYGKQVTFDHPEATVEPGPAPCAAGPQVDANSNFPPDERMWHVQGQNDAIKCYWNVPSDFDPSMPTGWLVTGGYRDELAVYSSQDPPPVSICNSNASGYSPSVPQAGGRPVFWRETSSGGKLYVCMFPQYAPFGQSPAQGWHYASPWRSEPSGAPPREAYIKLGPVAPANAQRLRPHLKFDSGEKWRPLDVDRFLDEPGNERCDDGFPSDSCVPVGGLTGLRSEPQSEYLDLNGHGAGEPDDYRSPSLAEQCKGGGGSQLQDCDEGPVSAIYWHAVEPPGDPYTYLDYWWFFRLNEQTANVHEGDWEGMTVASPKGDSGTFHWAAFAAHDGNWRYLRDVLECDGGGPGSCGTEASKSGARVNAYVARGGHATYPRACASDCSQTAAGGESWLFSEEPFGGQRPWGRNGDSAALVALPEAKDWDDPSVANWVDWEGLWGASGAGGVVGNSPPSPANQARYDAPWEADCTARNFNDPFAVDCSSGQPMRSAALGLSRSSPESAEPEPPEEEPPAHEEAPSEEGAGPGEEEPPEAEAPAAEEPPAPSESPPGDGAPDPATPDEPVGEHPGDGNEQPVGPPADGQEPCVEERESPTGPPPEAGAPCGAQEDPEEAEIPKACLPWTGPLVQIAVCEADELERSLDRGELGRQGDVELDAGDRREVAASAPGIAQLLGEPLEPGDRVAIVGEVPADAHVVVRVEEGTGVVEARFEGSDLPEAGTVVVEDHGGDAEVRIVAPGRGTIKPDAEERLPEVAPPTAP